MRAKALTYCLSLVLEEITEAMFKMLLGVLDDAIDISDCKSTNKGWPQQEDGNTLTMTTNMTSHSPAEFR